MWLLHFLPDSLIHLAVFAAVGAGLGLYVLGLFISFIPPAIPYKEPIKFFAVVLLALGVYGYGAYNNEMSWRAREADLKHQIEISELKSQTANEALSNALVKNNQLITDNKTKVKEVLTQHATEIDASCKVPKLAIDLINNAARGLKE